MFVNMYKYMWHPWYSCVRAAVKIFLDALMEAVSWILPAEAWFIHTNYVADERHIFIITTVEVMFGFDCYYVSCSYDLSCVLQGLPLSTMQWTLTMKVPIAGLMPGSLVWVSKGISSPALSRKHNPWMKVGPCHQTFVYAHCIVKPGIEFRKGKPDRKGRRHYI